MKQRIMVRSFSSSCSSGEMGQHMGWLVALAGLLLLIVLKFKVADRVTLRNLVAYGKLLAAAAALLILWLIVAVASK